MGVELPLFTAFVARMADPEINLAAYGSVAFPISLVIEGPVIMLLAAATALCSDWRSYRKVHRFMTVLSAILTAVHIAIAFTPLFELVVHTLLDVPEEVVEPARLGLQIMTPWTWAIAYRRMHQGVLIRFERSQWVMLGTLVRLAVLLAVLVTGFAFKLGPGIAVGAGAVAAAVTAEAIFIRVISAPILRDRLRPAPDLGKVKSWGAFLSFYVPLAMTPLLTLIIQPAGTAAMSRMPAELASLAAWPAVHSLVFLTRSSGFAFNEVVVALLGREGGARALRRFGLLLAAVTMAVLLILGWTPLAGWWFGRVSGLNPELSRLSSQALLFAFLMPGYQAMQSWYQGILVHRHRTRGITEGVLLYLVVALAGLSVAVAWGRFPGIFAALVAFSTGGVLQTLWLRHRAAPILAELPDSIDSSKS